MKIDGNETEKKAMEAFLDGDAQKGHQLQDAFLAEFHREYDGKDHCSCTTPCKHHGHCLDCVTIHRGHRDHLPACFHDMVNERLVAISGMTETHPVSNWGDGDKEKG